VISSLALASFLIAAVLTWQVRRIALARGHLDLPNSRSSHVVPTPRGGGLAIVAAVTLCLLGSMALHLVDQDLAAALLTGGLPIALIGFIDDRREVAARIRLVIHIVAACLSLYLLGGLPPLQFGNIVVDLGIFGDVLGVVAIVWTINLFNFMDGIDGIAASESLFITACAAGLAIVSGAATAVSAPAILVAAASLGFLIWNWPPAKIFMGDVGSGYLGFVVAVFALAEARENSVAPFVWLILGGAFFVDATITLVRRVLRGERAHVAHRSHAYQWLSRRWRGHKPVTLGIFAVNVAWLLPLAWLCRRYPPFAVYALIIALIPVAVLAFIAGAGEAERPVP
jgi:Fuc2NAc and GlcNAc transferase